MKRKYLLGIIGIAVAGLLASCGTENTSTTTTTTIASDDTETTTASDDTETTTASDDTETTTDDSDETVEETTYTVTDSFTITTAVENGFSYDSTSGLLTFSVAGDYTLEGVLNGYIECAATLTEKVCLALNGVTITSENPAISWLSENSKVEIKAKKDTTNYLVTTASTTLTNNTVDSENNVEFSGKGTLSIVNNQKNAVAASEVTITSEIELNITANSKDGIHAKQVDISNGNITITAVKDAIQAEINSKGNKGTITITGGTLTIKDSSSALKADTSITFADPTDTEVIGILLKFSSISDAALDCATVTNTSTALSYYLDGTQVTI